ncbi:hypothetical protein [Enterococcus phage vB_EfKS5]|nr:hypothetical protein [Enterococcus phage vB_EfKS5]
MESYNHVVISFNISYVKRGSGNLSQSPFVVVLFPS